MLVTLLLASALVGAPPTPASGPLRALPRAAAVQATVAQEYQNGFVWVPLLTDLLRREYIAERSRYPTLDSFSGRILEALATRRSVADAPRATN